VVFSRMSGHRRVSSFVELYDVVYGCHLRASLVTVFVYTKRKPML
jgi:hypothetical protein